MAMSYCPECGKRISEQAIACPDCGYPLRPQPIPLKVSRRRGYEYRSRINIMGWPLVHIAFGKDPRTGKRRVAKGVIAIGQFAVGVFTIAQFGIALVFGFGQFIIGPTAIAQFAFAAIVGVGQFSCGYAAVGQFAVGYYVLAQIGFGAHVYSTQVQDPAVLDFFHSIWKTILGSTAIRFS